MILGSGYKMCTGGKRRKVDYFMQYVPLLESLERLLNQELVMYEVSLGI